MRLSERLQRIACMVPEGSFVVDIGTDHAYLPVWLVEQEICPGALAMDLRDGPLRRAKEHIEQHGLEGRIRTLKSDGLKAFNSFDDFCKGGSLFSGEAKTRETEETYDRVTAAVRSIPVTLVIAGMGGPLMERILSHGSGILPLFQTAVLQPQSDLPHFRRFLRIWGLETEAEAIVLEDNKFYPMLRCRIGGKGSSCPPPGKAEENDAGYSLSELFGEGLLKTKEPILLKYLERELRICLKIEASLESAAGSQGTARREQVRGYRAKVEEAMRCFRS